MDDCHLIILSSWNQESALAEEPVSRLDAGVILILILGVGRLLRSQGILLVRGS